MKYISKSNIKIITGSPAEVELETNNFINQLAKQGIESSLRVEVNPLTSIIQYKTEIQKTENAEDRFSIMGIRCHCKDCKHFSKRKDGRVKWGSCTKNCTADGRMNRTKDESPACELFYEELELQNIKAS